LLVPLSWIRDFAPFEGDPRQLASTLDDLGLVVESIKRVGEGLDDVVVARVVSIDPIPGADKIRRVSVVADDGNPVEVVCGAWNFSVGDLVPFAPVGAVLPGDFEIGRRKMKGVTSNGMLCSGRELELSDDHAGILVLAPVSNSDQNAPRPELGTPLTEALGIRPDVVFDVAVEANRPDALSMAGIARDLAARLGLPFAIPDPPAMTSPRMTSAGSEVSGIDVSEPTSDLTTIEVVDRDLCPRFTARVVRGVKVGPSPQWVTTRLTLAGMRPINSVVDASNYVMLELGQPTHPYDLDRVAGGGLVVRAARIGERVVTLDGEERVMGSRSVGPGDDRRDCLICDAENRPIGIAGIMGGASTEIIDSTSSVLLEAAYFDPMSVARTSKRLSLRTEASARFERGCDPEGIDRAALRFIELLAGQPGEPGQPGQPGQPSETSQPSQPDQPIRQRLRVAPGSIDVRGTLPSQPRPKVRISRVNAILGSELSEDDVARYLEPIGFRTQVLNEDEVVVTVPTFRPDTTREIDVIEEVARHLGYGNLPRRRPFAPQVGKLTWYQRERRVVREIVAGIGAEEAWTSSMLGPDDHLRAGMGEGGVKVANPISPSESVLRRSLLPGLLKALAFNADRRNGDLRLFEIGHVFPPPDENRVERAQKRLGTVIDERELLGVLFARQDDNARSSSAAWTYLTDALRVCDVAIVVPTSDAEVPAGLHPTRSARLFLPGEPPEQIGVLGEVDPAVVAAFGLAGSGQRRIGWFEVDLELLLSVAPRRSLLLETPSRFPSSDIDLAFSVPETVPSAIVESTLRIAAGELLEDVWLFDVYRGEGVEPGERSLAYRLRFCAHDRTLTDAEVGELRVRCIDAVEGAHEAKLRG